MSDPDRTRESSRASQGAPLHGEPGRLPQGPELVRPEGSGQARDGALPERRRTDPSLAGPDAPGEVERRASDRRQGDRRQEDRRTGVERRAGVDRRSGTDRRSLMGHARDLATRFRQPLIGLGVAAAAMPLIRAENNRAEAAREAASEHAAGSAEAVASAARAAAPSRDIDAEVGARWGNVERSTTIGAAVDRYGITADLASQIYDHAKDAGVDPKMAYGLVKTESDFRNTAVSRVGARGLTQLMPRTARWLEPGTKASDLFETETSLKVGFKYLRQLIDRYEGNRHLALTAYNRGPGTVEKSLKKGRDPDNGYAGTVLRNALRGVADSMGLGHGGDGPG